MDQTLYRLDGHFYPYLLSNFKNEQFWDLARQTNKYLLFQMHEEHINGFILANLIHPGDQECTQG